MPLIPKTLNSARTVHISAKLSHTDMNIFLKRNIGFAKLPHKDGLEAVPKHGDDPLKTNISSRHTPNGRLAKEGREHAALRNLA